MDSVEERRKRDRKKRKAEKGASPNSQKSPETAPFTKLVKLELTDHRRDEDDGLASDRRKVGSPSGRKGMKRMKESSRGPRESGSPSLPQGESRVLIGADAQKSEAVECAEGGKNVWRGKDGDDEGRVNGEEERKKGKGYSNRSRGGQGDGIKERVGLNRGSRVVAGERRGSDGADDRGFGSRMDAASPGNRTEGDQSPEQSIPAAGAGSVGRRGRGRSQKTRSQPSASQALTTPLGNSALSPDAMAEDEMGEDVKDAPFMDAVVKVFCTHTEPNFSLPWQRKRQYSSNSSGFIIGGRRVLTNAHSVEHYTQVKVKRRGSDIKYVASVLAIGTECDIALLAVEDATFWEGVEPLEFGPLPRLQDAVIVVGYPIGGDTISVTSGVVSRIEVTAYVHGAMELLGLQIDAAINSGNSGGPAFNKKGQCVGIAFQSLKHDDAENIGYVIPTPVITHFITDYERNGEYTGFPVLGIEWQKMENPQMRKALGMKEGEKGVRVRRVEPTAPAAQMLFPSDILLSFDGVGIANDGTVPFRHGERISFSYLVSLKYTGESANIRVLRGMQRIDMTVDLANQKRLVPVHIKGKAPSYYIVAGIVFTPISVPYLKSEYGKDYDYEAPVKLLDKLVHVMAGTEDEQVVVISQVLVADINIGYEDIVNTQVLAFNGNPVRNLQSLAKMAETCQDQYFRFDLDYQQALILERDSARAATQEILKTHCIPSAFSEDLQIS